MTFDKDQLVADCLDAVRSADGHTGVAVEEVLARAVSNPAAIEAAIGHPRDQAVFSTWFTSDELTVLHVVWPPAVDLMPHDHRMWASIGLYGGREDNRIFRSLPEGIEYRRTTTLRRGDTILLGDQTVHAVANPSREWTGAIHVYGGDYFKPGKHMWTGAEETEQPFDFDRLRAVLTEAATQARIEEANR